MEYNNNIQELMETAPSIVNLDQNMYSVPISYFDELPKQILDQIKAGTEAKYYFSKNTPFHVPSGYFDNLAENILAKIKETNYSVSVTEETEEIAPLLNTISKKPVFSVPDGYFGKMEIPTFSVEEKAKIEFPVAEPTKVVSLPASRSRKLMTYAVAAVITAFLAIGMYLLTTKDTVNKTTQYSNANADVKKLSDQEIIELLKAEQPTEEFSPTKNTNKTAEEINNSLSQMSDKEIEEFLQENGVNVEI